MQEWHLKLNAHQYISKAVKHRVFWHEKCKNELWFSSTVFFFLLESGFPNISLFPVILFQTFKWQKKKYHDVIYKRILLIGLYTKEALSSSDLFICLFWGNEKRWCNVTANFLYFPLSSFSESCRSRKFQIVSMAFVNLLCTASHPGCVPNPCPLFLEQVLDPPWGHWREGWWVTEDE